MARLGAERGGVVVTVAITMLAFAAIVAVGLQIGNWYTHRRHLQLQTDAAAFAAGQRFSKCLTDPSGAFAAMQDTANQYGGFVKPGFNYQVGYKADGTPGPAAGALQPPNYNSKSYPTGSSHPDDPDSIPAGACGVNAMFDVKATETTIPGPFKFLPLGEVNAHSRIELKVVNQMDGLAPMAVPDPRFSYVFATFINEANGAAIAPEAQLTKSGTNAAGEQIWNTQVPVDVPINADRIGVRIRIVGGNDPTRPCGELFAECFLDSATYPNRGVVFIRGWSDVSSPPTPVAKNVWLLPNTCPNGAYFTIADCNAGIQAEMDFGDRPVSGSGVTATVTASIAGGGTVSLTRGSAIAGTTYNWSAPGGLAIVGPGLHDVSLAWSWQQTTGTWRGNTCTTTGSNPCKGNATIANVQRAFEGSLDDSGPLRAAQVYEAGVSLSGANSFERGATRTLGVSLATLGTLAVQAAATDPIVYLRVARSGSQSQWIDCDPDIPNLRGEIANGCAPTYIKNPSLDCPPPFTYNTLWNGYPPQSAPWPCVKVQTSAGNQFGPINQGLKDRVLGGANTCTAPINWPYDEDLYPQDTRVIPLIIAPWGSFSGSGNTVVPVVDFAAFYVMGWNGDPCPGAVSVPNGYIAGHFIKYIPRDPRGVGDVACDIQDPSQVTPCVGVLTR